jgi:hypothetical protein
MENVFEENGLKLNFFLSGKTYEFPGGMTFYDFLGKI